MPSKYRKHGSREWKKLKALGLVPITCKLFPNTKSFTRWGLITNREWIERFQDEIDPVGERLARIVPDAQGWIVLYALPAPDLIHPTNGNVPSKASEGSDAVYIIPARNPYAPRIKHCRICKALGLSPRETRLSRLNSTGQHHYHTLPPDKRSEADLRGQGYEMEE
jgi:hypothetical protein